MNHSRCSLFEEIEGEGYTTSIMWSYYWSSYLLGTLWFVQIWCYYIHSHSMTTLFPLEPPLPLIPLSLHPPSTHSPPPLLPFYHRMSVCACAVLETGSPQHFSPRHFILNEFTCRWRTRIPRRFDYRRFALTVSPLPFYSFIIRWYYLFINKSNILFSYVVGVNYVHHIFIK